MSPFDGLKLRLSKGLEMPWADATLVGKSLSAKEDIVQLLKQSVTFQADGRGGECISALLIGPNGAGKTLVVKSAIDQLESEGSQVISITLHGKNCSDDKSSMRQIFSQFQRHLVGRSSTDSLSRVNFRTGTLSEWCERLQRLLEECARADYMVVITLEDFEAFCHSRAKQSLLYNLFDLMHVKEARFVVIGITCRPDTTELLEKRIKSRFQLRKILLSGPDSVDEVIEVVRSIVCSEKIEKAPTGNRRRNTLGRESTPSSVIEEVLNSKELRQVWSFYWELGYSIREFVTAAVSSILKADSVEQVQDSLVNCMAEECSTSKTDVGSALSQFRSLTLRDHIVLVGLLKLHQYGKRPKCFMNILKEIGSFEKRGGRTQICSHSKRAYWHSFRGLIRQGFIESLDFGGLSAAVAPPPMFTRCRLTIFESYRNTLLGAEASKNKLLAVPLEVIQWACQSKDIYEGV
jgi:hypothetical protein